uniref:Uncharacterized protein n=1 Tax=Knipowitschia caucasica TaxID=637954 RepID=A0AAV2KJ83_KNICA
MSVVVPVRSGASCCCEARAVIGSAAANERATLRLCGIGNTLQASPGTFCAEEDLRFLPCASAASGSDMFSVFWEMIPRYLLREDACGLS